MTNQEQPDTRHLDPCFSCDDRRDSHYDGGCVGSCANECNGFEEYPYAPPAPDTQSGGRPTLAERARDEALAALFHAVYERLAPQYGYETRSESAVPWSQVPENNKRLMIAVAAEVGSAIRAESSAALQEARDQRAFFRDELVKAESTIAGLREQVEGLRVGLNEAAAHIESLMGHTVNETGAMVLFAADLNALTMRALDLRAATRPVKGI